jgi:hypothetical protein
LDDPLFVTPYLEHPSVAAVRGDLEQKVLEGATPSAAAARQILEAFGHGAPGD